jgi:hypothetical protein
MKEKTLLLSKKHWITLNEAIPLKNIKVVKNKNINKYLQHFIKAVHGDIGTVKDVMEL